MGNEPLPTRAGDDYPHWGRVYLAVIVFTVLVFWGLWAFARLYD